MGRRILILNTRGIVFSSYKYNTENNHNRKNIRIR